MLLRTRLLSTALKRLIFLSKKWKRVLNDEDDPFAGLDDIEEDSVQKLGADLAFLKERFGNQVDPNIALDECINFGISVTTTHGKLTNHKILAEIN